MNFGETDIGEGMTVSVTNEDLRNDLTRVTEILRGAVRGIDTLTKDAETGANERRADAGRITALYAGLSVLRWALGLVSAAVGAVCFWVITNVNDAINTNRTQEIRINSEEQANRIQDTRIQALERGQFATTIKEKQ